VVVRIVVGLGDEEFQRYDVEAREVGEGSELGKGLEAHQDAAELEARQGLSRGGAPGQGHRAPHAAERDPLANAHAERDHGDGTGGC
jgi:hypothetical protein